MRKLDPKMKCSLPPAKQKKKKKVCIFIYKYMYSKRVFLECANDRMWTDKTKMQICKKKEGWTLVTN